MAVDVELHLVARLLLRDGVAQLLVGLDRVAVDTDEDVTAEEVALPWTTTCVWPGRSPALAAPLPGVTLRIKRPVFVGRLKSFASRVLTSCVSIPMNAWSTLPFVISCAATLRTVLIGTAKPMPMLPCCPVLPVRSAT